MFALSRYGVPEDFPSAMDAFFTSEIKELSAQLTECLMSSGADFALTFKTNKLFKFALGYLAWSEQHTVLIPLVYQVSRSDLSLVHFEWKIPHPFQVSFSNAYFLVFYNQLYKFHGQRGDFLLTKRGVILHALAELSYTPWNRLFLPVSERMNTDFLNLPLLDVMSCTQAGGQL